MLLVAVLLLERLVQEFQIFTVPTELSQAYFFAKDKLSPLERLHLFCLYLGGILEASSILVECTGNH